MIGSITRRAALFVAVAWRAVPTIAACASSLQTTTVISRLAWLHS